MRPELEHRAEAESPPLPRRAIQRSVGIENQIARLHPILDAEAVQHGLCHPECQASGDKRLNKRFALLHSPVY